LRKQKWTRYFLIGAIGYTGFLAGINFLIDPYWYFDHKNRFNGYQIGFNERQQKSNHIANTSMHYDAILVGSSRVAYVDQNVFSFAKVYNFAVSSMGVGEYQPYIRFFKEKMNVQPSYIIIGMDFSATNKNKPRFDTTDPQQYFDNAVFSPGKLINLDLLMKSLHNVEFGSDEHSSDLHAYYDRENRKFMFRSKNAELHKEMLESDLIRFKQNVYGETYQYDMDLARRFEDLKKENPNSKFIAYTTPVSKPLFEAMIEKGRLKDYERWLTCLVIEFGSVWHFMDMNSVTENYSENFVDGHHAYPHIANLIAKKITNPSDPSVPSDFGILLTKDNLKSYLKTLEKKVHDERYERNRAF